MAPLLFRIRIDSKVRHYFKVIWEVTTEETNFEFLLPVWTPGSYLVRDFSTHLHKMLAYDSEGNPLSVEWISTSSWKIVNAPKRLTIEYLVYAYEDFSVRTCYLDHSFAFINSPALFLYPKQGLDREVSIIFETEQEYSFVYSALPRSENNLFHFLASDYDTLFDSPFHLSNKTSTSFQTHDCVHELLIEGDVTSAFALQLTEDIKLITAKQLEKMTFFPNPYYLFVLNLSQSAYGGLEHSASSINYFDPEQIRKEENYTGLLELLSHEYFHLWNVKRIRPIALGPFDYQTQNLTKELWVAEGITSFLDSYFLLLAGVLPKSNYLERIKEDILFLEDSPADEWMSLEESSFTAWNKFYKKNGNSQNTGVSYYTKGFGIALAMDIRLRELTNGEKNIIHLMRSLYSKFFLKKSRGFTKEEFFFEVSSLCGQDLYLEFKPYLENRVKIPLTAYLEKIGLALSDGIQATDWGFSVKEKKGNLFVFKLNHRASDPNADLHIDDEILAVNGKRIDFRKFAKQEELLVPGEKVRLLISHHGKIKEILYTLGNKLKNRKLESMEVEMMDEKQKRLYLSFFEEGAL